MKILFLKFLTITVTIYVIFGAANYVDYDLLWIGVFTTIISYMIGDLLLLPKLIGARAILADFGLGFATVWLLARFFIHVNLPIATLALISAFLFTAVEPFVHTYLLKVWRQKELSNEEPERIDEMIKRLGYRHTDDIPTVRSRYATEFAQELHIHDVDHDFYKEHDRRDRQLDNE